MSQENLKKAIGVINSLVEQGEKSFSDGVQGKDFFDFIPPAMAAGNINWKEAIAEAKNRDEASNAELLEFIKSDFDIQNDEAEKKVEALIAGILAIDNVYNSFKKSAA